MICLLSITIIDVLIALGFSTVGVLNPQAILPPGVVVTSAATTYALYGFVRSLGLAGFVLSAALRKEMRLFLWLAALAGLIQLLDAAVGIYQSDATKILGPLSIAIAQFWAIAKCSRSPAPMQFAELRDPGCAHRVEEDAQE